MLAMPSLWILLISTLVFFLAVWQLNRFLHEQGIQKGFARGALVAAIATITSGAVEAGLSRFEHHDKPVAPPVIAPADDAVSAVKDTQE